MNNDIKLNPPSGGSNVQGNKDEVEKLRLELKKLRKSLRELESIVSSLQKSLQDLIFGIYPRGNN